MNNYPALERGTGVHRVKYTLQSGAYKGSFTRVLGGNCKGSAMMDSDVFDVLDEIDMARMEYDHLKLRYNEDCDGIDVDFLADDGDIVCRIGAESFDSYELSRLIVAIEIISFVGD